MFAPPKMSNNNLKQPCSDKLMKTKKKKREVIHILITVYD